MPHPPAHPAAQLRFLSRIRHPHLVDLLGFCDEAGQQILVYEFMSRGNVRDQLYGEPPACLVCTRTCGGHHSKRSAVLRSMARGSDPA